MLAKCPVCHHRTRIRFFSAWTCKNCLSRLRLGDWGGPDIYFAPLFLLLPMLREVEVLEHSPFYCRGCCYDLTGNESGVCPECGRPCDAGGRSDGAS